MYQIADTNYVCTLLTKICFRSPGPEAPCQEISHLQEVSQPLHNRQDSEEEEAVQEVPHQVTQDCQEVGQVWRPGCRTWCSE